MIQQGRTGEERTPRSKRSTQSDSRRPGEGGNGFDSSAISAENWMGEGRGVGGGGSCVRRSTHHMAYSEWSGMRMFCWKTVI